MPDRMAGRQPPFLEYVPDLGACRLCGCTSGQRVHWAEAYVDTGQELRRCGCCAALYLAPDFTDACLDRFYAEAYRRLFPGERPWLSRERFFAWRGDRDIARQRVNMVAPTLPPDARVLELGSGFGAFLGQLHRRRGDVVLEAVEPDRQGRDLLLDGAPVTFREEREQVAPGSLDALMLFHVLEHLADPRGLFEWAGRVLRPGGRLWVEVPDVMSPWRSRAYVHPAHLTYFSASTLARLGLASGLEQACCGVHPCGGVLAENLWASWIRPPGDLDMRQLQPATEAEIDRVDARVQEVGWRRIDRLRRAARRTAVAVFGAGAVGELQRWRHHRRMRGRPV